MSKDTAVTGTGCEMSAGEASDSRTTLCSEADIRSVVLNGAPNKTALTQCSRLIHTARFADLIESCLERLEAALTEKLDTEVSVNYDNRQDAGDTIDEHFWTDGCVCLHLKLFQESLYLLVSPALVRAVSQKVLSQGQSSKEECPTSEEMTAFGYLVTELLSMKSLFENQRVCLAALRLGETAEGKDAYLKELDARARAGELLALNLAVLIDEAEYQMEVLLSCGCARRFSQYGRHQLRQGSPSGILSKVSTCWSVSMTVELTSLSTLVSANPGEKLHIRVSKGQLQQIPLLNEAGVSAGCWAASPAVLGFELVEPSVPGLFRMRLLA